MPGPRDRNKGSWQPVREGLGARRASSPPRGRHGAARPHGYSSLGCRPTWATASYDDGHRVIGRQRTASGASTGTRNELVTGTQRIRSVEDMAAVLELLAPAADLLRDTSPAAPVCVHWRHARDGLRLDVFSMVEGKGRAMALARKRDEEIRQTRLERRARDGPLCGREGLRLPGGLLGPLPGGAASSSSERRRVEGFRMGAMCPT